MTYAKLRDEISKDSIESIAAMKEVIAQDFTINQQDEDGNTLLHHVVSQSAMLPLTALAKYQLLLESGIDATIKNKAGHSAYQVSGYDPEVLPLVAVSALQAHFPNLNADKCFKPQVRYVIADRLPAVQENEGESWWHHFVCKLLQNPDGAEGELVPTKPWHYVNNICGAILHFGPKPDNTEHFEIATHYFIDSDTEQVCYLNKTGASVVVIAPNEFSTFQENLQTHFPDLGTLPRFTLWQWQDAILLTPKAVQACGLLLKDDFQRKAFLQNEKQGAQQAQAIAVLDQLRNAYKAMQAKPEIAALAKTIFDDGIFTCPTGARGRISKAANQLIAMTLQPANMFDLLHLIRTKVIDKLTDWHGDFRDIHFNNRAITLAATIFGVKAQEAADAPEKIDVSETLSQFIALFQKHFRYYALCHSLVDELKLFAVQFGYCEQRRPSTWRVHVLEGCFNPELRDNYRGTYAYSKEASVLYYVSSRGDCLKLGECEFIAIQRICEKIDDQTFEMPSNVTKREQLNIPWLDRDTLINSDEMYTGADVADFRKLLKELLLPPEASQKDAMVFFHSNLARYQWIDQATEEQNLLSLQVYSINWHEIAKRVMQWLDKAHLFKAVYEPIIATDLSLDFKLPQDHAVEDVVDYFDSQSMSLATFKYCLEAYIQKFTLSQKLLDALLVTFINKQQADIVRFLIARGASVDAAIDNYALPDKNNVSSLVTWRQQLVFRQYPNVGRLPQKKAKSNNTKQGIKRVALPKLKYHWYFLQRTALMQAIGLGSVELFELALSRSKNINSPNCYGWTALHETARLSHYDADLAYYFAERLIFKGANPDLHLPESSNLTPAGLAHPDSEMRQYLLRAQMTRLIASNDSKAIGDFLRNSGLEPQLSDLPLLPNTQKTSAELLKEAEEKCRQVTSDLKRQLDSLQDDEVIVQQKLSQLQEMRLLAQDQILTGFTVAGDMQPLHTVAASLLQRVFGQYQVFPLSGDQNTPMPQHWQQHINNILAAAELAPDADVTEENLTKLLNGLNGHFASDNVNLTLRVYTKKGVSTIASAQEDATVVTLYQAEDQFLLLAPVQHCYTPRMHYLELLRMATLQGSFLNTLGEFRVEQLLETTIDKASITEVVGLVQQEVTELKSINFFEHFFKLIENAITDTVLKQYPKLQLVKPVLERLAQFEKNKMLKTENQFRDDVAKFKYHYIQALQFTVQQELLKRQQHVSQQQDDNPIHLLEKKAYQKRKNIEHLSKQLEIKAQALTDEHAALDQAQSAQQQIQHQLDSDLASIEEELADLYALQETCKANLASATVNVVNQNANTDQITAEHGENDKLIQELESKRASLAAERDQVQGQIAALAEQKTRLEARSLQLDNDLAQAETFRKESEAALNRVTLLLEYIEKARQLLLDSKMVCSEKQESIRSKFSELQSDPDFNLQVLHAYLVEDLEFLTLDEEKYTALFSDAMLYAAEALDACMEVVASIKYYFDPETLVLRLTALNLKVSDGLEQLRQVLVTQLSTYGIGVTDQDALDITPDVIALNEMPSPLKNTLQRSIKLKRQRDKTHSSQDRERWSVFETTSTEETRDVLKTCDLKVNDILSSIIKRVEFVAGQHVFIDEDIVLPGVDVTVFAGVNIDGKEDAVINTSTADVPDYQHVPRPGSAYQIHENKPNGAAGENGLNGLPGLSAGHITLQAGQSIVHLSSLSCFANGGRGGHGQAGGDGDKGIQGGDADDAIADDPASKKARWYHIFGGPGDLSTVFAEAHTPGVPRPGKNDEDVANEVSGRGGNGGKAGLGAKGGLRGDITVIDHKHHLAFAKDALPREDASLGENLEQRFQANTGQQGHAGALTSQGGESGEAGYLGAAMMKRRWYVTKWKFGIWPYDVWKNDSWQGHPDPAWVDRTFHPQWSDEPLLQAIFRGNISETGATSNYSRQYVFKHTKLAHPEEINRQSRQSTDKRSRSQHQHVKQFGFREDSAELEAQQVENPFNESSYRQALHAQVAKLHHSQALSRSKARTDAATERLRADVLAQEQTVTDVRNEQAQVETTLSTTKEQLTEKEQLEKQVNGNMAAVADAMTVASQNQIELNAQKREGLNQQRSAWSAERVAQLALDEVTIDINTLTQISADLTAAQQGDSKQLADIEQKQAVKLAALQAELTVLQQEVSTNEGELESILQKMDALRSKQTLLHNEAQFITSVLAQVQSHNLTQSDVHEQTHIEQTVETPEDASGIKYTPMELTHAKLPQQLSYEKAWAMVVADHNIVNSPAEKVALVMAMDLIQAESFSEEQITQLLSNISACIVLKPTLTLLELKELWPAFARLNDKWYGANQDINTAIATLHQKLFSRSEEILCAGNEDTQKILLRICYGVKPADTIMVQQHLALQSQFFAWYADEAIPQERRECDFRQFECLPSICEDDDRARLKTLLNILGVEESESYAKNYLKLATTLIDHNIRRKATIAHSQSPSPGDNNPNCYTQENMSEQVDQLEHMLQETKSWDNIKPNSVSDICIKQIRRYYIDLLPELKFSDWHQQEPDRIFEQLEPVLSLLSENYPNDIQQGQQDIESLLQQANFSTTTWYELFKYSQSDKKNWFVPHINWWLLDEGTEDVDKASRYLSQLSELKQINIDTVVFTQSHGLLANLHSDLEELLAANRFEDDQVQANLAKVLTLIERNSTGLAVSEQLKRIKKIHDITSCFKHAASQATKEVDRNVAANRFADSADTLLRSALSQNKAYLTTALRCKQDASYSEMLNNLNERDPQYFRNAYEHFVFLLQHDADSVDWRELDDKLIELNQNLDRRDYDLAIVLKKRCYASLNEIIEYRLIKPLYDQATTLANSIQADEKVYQDCVDNRQQFSDFYLQEDAGVNEKKRAFVLLVLRQCATLNIAYNNDTQFTDLIAAINIKGNETLRSAIENLDPLFSGNQCEMFPLLRDSLSQQAVDTKTVATYLAQLMRHIEDCLKENNVQDWLLPACENMQQVFLCLLFDNIDQQTELHYSLENLRLAIMESQQIALETPDNTLEKIEKICIMLNACLYKYHFYQHVDVMIESFSRSSLHYQRRENLQLIQQDDVVQVQEIVRVMGKIGTSDKRYTLIDQCKAVLNEESFMRDPNAVKAQLQQHLADKEKSLQLNAHDVSFEDVMKKLENALSLDLMQTPQHQLVELCLQLKDCRFTVDQWCGLASKIKHLDCYPMRVLPLVHVIVDGLLIAAHEQLDEADKRGLCRLIDFTQLRAFINLMPKKMLDAAVAYCQNPTCNFIDELCLDSRSQLFENCLKDNPDAPFMSASEHVMLFVALLPFWDDKLDLLNVLIRDYKDDLERLEPEQSMLPFILQQKRLQYFIEDLQCDQGITDRIDNAIQTLRNKALLARTEEKLGLSLILQALFEAVQHAGPEAVREMGLFITCCKDKCADTEFLRYFLSPEEALYVDYFDKDKVFKSMQENKPEKWLKTFKQHYWRMLSDELIHNEQPNIVEFAASVINFNTHFESLCNTTNIVMAKEKAKLLRDKCNQIPDPDRNQVLERVKSIADLKHDLILQYSQLCIEQSESVWIQLTQALCHQKKQGLALAGINTLLSIYKSSSQSQQILSLIQHATSHDVVFRCSFTLFEDAVIQHVYCQEGESVDLQAFTAPAFTGEIGCRFLVILANALQRNTGFSCDSLDAAAFKVLIAQLLSVHAYDDSVLLDDLEKRPIYYWQAALKRRELALQLSLKRGVVTSDAILDNLVFLQNTYGATIVQEFIQPLLKPKAIDYTELAWLLPKFVSLEWPFDQAVVTTFVNWGVASWREKAEEYFQERLDKDRLERSAEQLETLMQDDTTGVNAGVAALLQNNTLSSLILRIRDRARQLSSKFPTLTYEDAAKHIKDMTSNRSKGFLAQGGQLDDDQDLIAFLAFASVVYAKIHSNGNPTRQLRDTQLIALICFIRSFGKNTGRIANILTGEGKTVVTQLLAIACVMRGGKADVITSSAALAEPNADEAKEICQYFGLNVSNICDQQCRENEQERIRRYTDNDILYGDVGSFQRDMLLTECMDKNIRPMPSRSLVIDEVDSLLIDNASRVLFISHNIPVLRHLRHVFVFIWSAVNASDMLHQKYSPANAKKIKQLYASQVAEGVIAVPSSLDEEFIELHFEQWIKSAFRARTINDEREYSVMNKGDGKTGVVINDLATGVEQMNSRWGNGLHAFIELKHREALSAETLRAVYVSNVSYVKRFGGHVYGMTGTVGRKAELAVFQKVFNMDSFSLPPFKRKQFKQAKGVVTPNSDTLFYSAIIDVVQARTQPRTQVSAEDMAQAKVQCGEITLLLKQAKQVFADDNNTIIRLQREKKQLATTACQLTQAILDVSSVDDKGQLREVEKVTAEKEELRNKKSQLDQRIQQKQYEIKTLLEKVLKQRNTITQTQQQLRTQQALADGRGGQAVLVICEDKRTAEYIHRQIEAIRDQAKTHLHPVYSSYVEGAKLDYELLQPGDIVVATNLAGRGTDFHLSPTLVEQGGLHVVLSYMPSNVRIEAQAFGRAARNGQPGSGQFVVKDYRHSEQRPITIEQLREERDEREKLRLNELVQDKIPALELSQRLFEKYKMAQEHLRRTLKDKGYHHHFVTIQVKALQDRWTYWRDKHDSDINDAQRLDKDDFVADFEGWLESQMILVDQNTDMLVMSAGGYMSLGHYYMGQDQHHDAVRCFQWIIDNETQFNGFAYYYLAQAIINSGSSTRTKARARSALKHAVKAFDREVSYLSTHNQIVAAISRNEREAGKGLHPDAFTKTNTDEIGIINIHRRAAVTAMGKDITADSFIGGEAVEEESRRIFDKMLEVCSKDVIQGRRISRKAKIGKQDSTQQDALYVSSGNAPEFIGIPAEFNHCQSRVVELMRPYIDKQAAADRYFDYTMFADLLLTQSDFLQKIEPLVNKILVYTKHSDFDDLIKGSVFWQNAVFAGHGLQVKQCVNCLEFPADKETLSASLADKLSELNLDWSAVIDYFAHQSLVTEQDAYQINEQTQQKLNDYSSKFTLMRRDDMEAALKQLPLPYVPSLAHHVGEIRTVLLQNRTKKFDFNTFRDFLSEDAYKDLCHYLRGYGLTQYTLYNELKINRLDPDEHRLFEETLLSLSTEKSFSADQIDLPVDPQDSALKLWLYLVNKGFAKEPKVLSVSMSDSESKIKRMLERVKEEINAHMTDIADTVPNLQSPPRETAEKIALAREQQRRLRHRLFSQQQRSCAALNNNDAAIPALTPEQVTLLKEDDKRLARIGRLKDAINQALEESVGTLRTIHRVKVDNQHLKDFFKGKETRLPPVVYIFMRKACASVLSLVVDEEKDSNWFDCLVCALIGVAQIVAGVLIASFNPMLGKMLINEGVGDISFAVQGYINGDFSWEAYGEYKVRSLMTSMITSGVASQLATAGEAASVSLSISKSITKELIKAAVSVATDLAVNKVISELTATMVDSMLQEFEAGIDKTIRENATKHIDNIKLHMRQLYRSIGGNQANAQLQAALAEVDLNKVLHGVINSEAMQGMKTVMSKLSQFKPAKGHDAVTRLQTAAEIASYIKYILEAASFIESVSDIANTTEGIFKQLETAIAERASRYADRESQDQISDEKMNDMVCQQVDGHVGMVKDQIIAQIHTVASRLSSLGSSELLGPVLGEVQESIVNGIDEMFSLEPLQQARQAEAVRIMPPSPDEDTTAAVQQTEVYNGLSDLDPNTVVQTPSGECSVEQLEVVVEDRKQTSDQAGSFFGVYQEGGDLSLLLLDATESFNEVDNALQSRPDLSEAYYNKLSPFEILLNDLAKTSICSYISDLADDIFFGKIVKKNLLTKELNSLSKKLDKKWNRYNKLEKKLKNPTANNLTKKEVNKIKRQMVKILESNNKITNNLRTLSKRLSFLNNPLTTIAGYLLDAPNIINDPWGYVKDKGIEMAFYSAGCGMLLAPVPGARPLGLFMMGVSSYVPAIGQYYINIKEEQATQDRLRVEAQAFRNRLERLNFRERMRHSGNDYTEMTPQTRLPQLPSLLLFQERSHFTDGPTIRQSLPGETDRFERRGEMKNDR